MELTPRLHAVARQVPHGAAFADIGTDHAYLPVWLILNHVLNSAIAADLRPGPLSRAQHTAAYYGVADQISFRLCDGLSDIRAEEADFIAIAGMGGDTISMILEAAPWTKDPQKTLLLQPMTAFPDLRSWLQRNEYRIVSEEIVREGKRLYTIWNVRSGKMEQLSLGELWAGRQSNDPLRGDYLDYIAAKVSKALAGQLAASELQGSAIAHLKQILAELNQMKEEWLSWQV